MQDTLRQGFNALQVGQIETAGECCKRVLGAKPDLPEGHFLVGLIALETKQTRTAISAFGSVTKLNPRHGAAWAQLAKLFFSTGHTIRADEALEHAVKYEADDPIVHDLLGLIYSLQGDQQEAANWFNKAVTKSPDNPMFLVNNANINFPIKPFVELTWDEMEAKFMGEMKALYNCSQAVLKDMLGRKSGKLILISSSLSRFPGYGFAAHAAAKSAMDGMAKVVASELGPAGITVNVIGPGLTLTDATAGQPKEMHEQVAAITPLRRLGLPQDIAGAVVFLASSLSDYLSGEYLPVTGGSFMI